jgi:hypothetical protein
MSFTLGEAKLEVARLITRVVDSEATSGNTNTLYDNSFPWHVDEHNHPPQDDHYNGGTLIMRSGDNINQARVVYDWTRAGSRTGEVVVEAYSNSIAEGDTYSIWDRDYPNWMLEQNINSAYQALNKIPQYNYALSTLANSEEYSLPSGVYNVMVLEADDEADNTTDPRGWVPHRHWYEVDGKIRLKTGFHYTTSGRSIRLTYATRASRLAADTNTFSDLIHPDVIVSDAAVRVLRERFGFGGNLDRSEVPGLLTEMIERAKGAREEHPIPKVRKSQQFSSWMVD